MHPKIDYFTGPWRSLCALILALAAGLPTAMAADYYLDDTEGLDTNAGTSPVAVYDIGDNRTQTLWIRDNEVPTITVTAPISSAAEGDGAGVTAGQYTFTASSAPSDDLTLSHTMADTSINDVDYSYLPSMIVLPAGQTAVSLALTPMDDELPEVAETAVLTVVNSGLHNAGTTAGLTVTIAASDAPLATIAAADEAAAEKPVDTGRFVVTLSKIVTTNTAVNYTVGGTATSASDYTALTGSVTVAAGSNTATVASRTGYVIDPAYPSATVTILDATLPPYDAWLAGFTFVPGADKTTPGDPDGDGLANVVEYATGQNPTVSGTSPITFNMVEDNGSTYLQLSVNRNPAVTNVLIEGLSTSTLTDANSWSIGTTVTVTNTSSVFIVRDVVPISTTGKRFLRLRFTLLP